MTRQQISRLESQAAFIREQLKDYSRRELRQWLEGQLDKVLLRVAQAKTAFAMAKAERKAK